MNRILLILSSLIFAACSEKKASEETQRVKTKKEGIFFQNDSCVFLGIGVNTPDKKRTSILINHDFDQQTNLWVQNGIIFSALENGFQIKLLKYKHDKSFLEKIEAKLKKMHFYQYGPKMSYGVQVHRQKPVQEVYLIKSKTQWIIKVFPRNRL